MRWSKSAILLFGMTLGCFMMSCQKDRAGEDPKSSLEAYVTRSFAVKSVGDRASLEEMLTGEAKARLSSWSDEQFEKAFVSSKRKFEKLVIRDKKSLSAEEMGLTYEITYSEKTEAKETRTTNRKFATLVKESKGWRIREVKNLSEFIEFQGELALP